MIRAAPAALFAKADNACSPLPSSCREQVTIDRWKMLPNEISESNGDYEQIHLLAKQVKERQNQATALLEKLTKTLESTIPSQVNVQRSGRIFSKIVTSITIKFPRCTNAEQDWLNSVYLTIRKNPDDNSISVEKGIFGSFDTKLLSMAECIKEIKNQLESQKRSADETCDALESFIGKS